MKKVLKVLFIVTVASFLIISPALAVETSFTIAFSKVFNILVGIAGVIFVVMFLVGGIQYLTSAGNEESAGKAKKLLVDAVIGIIIVAMAYAAGKWLANQLGISVPTVTTSGPLQPGGGSTPTPVGPQGQQIPQ